MIIKLEVVIGEARGGLNLGSLGYRYFGLAEKPDIWLKRSQTTLVPEGYSYT